MVYLKEAIANKQLEFLSNLLSINRVVLKMCNLKGKGKKYFDDESIRVVLAMPKWKAELLSGKHVNTSLVLFVILEL